jgi:hypothetical protein
MPVGPCAKRRVIAILVVGDLYFTGENLCANAQRVCPRGPGQGYEACKSICAQDGHAEDMAIRAAKAALKRNAAHLLKTGTMHLFGHAAPCPACEALMNENGIRWIVQHVGRPAASACV